MGGSHLCAPKYCRHVRLRTVTRGRRQVAATFDALPGPHAKQSPSQEDIMNDAPRLPSTPNPSRANGWLSLIAGTALTAAATLLPHGAHAQAPAPQRPNILVIMGDDVGWFNIGAYHRGIMSGKTPN